jgi:signal transduction histidine kinase
MNIAFTKKETPVVGSPRTDLTAASGPPVTLQEMFQKQVKTVKKSSLVELWIKGMNVGLTPDIPLRAQKQLKSTNMVVMMCLIGMLFYIVQSLFMGNYLLAAIETGDIFLVATAMLLNKRGYFAASRIILMGIVNMFIFINAIYIGHEAMVQHFFVIISVVPFLVFDIDDYKNLGISIGITIATMVIYQLSYQYFTNLNLPSGTQLAVRELGLWIDFIIFGATIYMLAKSNYDIENEVEKKNKQLLDQTFELKRSNQDLEHFAYIISHDLKAPVRNVVNFLTLLQRRDGGSLSKEGNEFLAFSVDSGKRMDILIEELLQYCRVGNNLPASAPIDVNNMLKTLQIEMHDRERGTDSRIVVQKPMPVLQGIHSTMIYHVFQNLITNGLKFNRTKSPQVKIDVVEKKDKYIFEVRDNGIGIPMEYADKLFYMFRRLHTEAEFSGTGMGLAICKKIVTFYGGDIWFSSETGKGTSFYFSLPKAA